MADSSTVGLVIFTRDLSREQQGRSERCTVVNSLRAVSVMLSMRHFIRRAVMASKQDIEFYF